MAATSGAFASDLVKARQLGEEIRQKIEPILEGRDVGEIVMALAALAGFYGTQLPLPTVAIATGIRLSALSFCALMRDESPEDIRQQTKRLEKDFE